MRRSPRCRRRVRARRGPDRRELGLRCELRGRRKRRRRTYAIGTRRAGRRGNGLGGEFAPGFRRQRLVLLPLLAHLLFLLGRQPLQRLVLLARCWGVSCAHVPICWWTRCCSSAVIFG